MYFLSFSSESLQNQRQKSSQDKNQLEIAKAVIKLKIFF